MTLGLFDKFPQHIHFSEALNSTLPAKQLQQRLIQVFYEANKREFTFEEAAYPTIPNGKVIFEFGLADGEAFNFIDEEELKVAWNLLANERLDLIDFVCSIRYYKGSAEKKTALKFDYYLIRTMYNGCRFEIHVAHERGPRHLSPADLAAFISRKMNEGSNPEILKPTTTELT